MKSQRLAFAAGLFITALFLRHASAQQPPCCSIMAIDPRTNTASAKVNATGQILEFRVSNPRLTPALKVGQSIYANLTAKQISLDGKSVCCQIIQVDAAPVGVLLTERSAPTVSRGASSSGCRQSWLPKYNGVICKSTNPSKPAILFVHGLHQSAESWTKPSSTGYNYDYSHTPKDVDLGKHSAPNAGLYKAGLSDWLDVDSLNWFDHFAQQGFTVATWTQPCCNFEKAYPSALDALVQFATDVAAMNPSAPPPIALVGHSRGGLVIHQLLRQQGNFGGRIRWAITIHSPHHGSMPAKTPQVIAEQAVDLFGAVELPPDVKNPLKDIAFHLVSPLNQLIDDGSKELAPDSALITGLLNGDAPVPGVQYFTFGGTSPLLARLYTWFFTPMSAVPQYKGLDQYFDWQAKAAEVGLVSPLLNSERAIVPELKAGVGDSLVTDQSARLPYSVHETDQLNHAEVLWNRALQQKVVSILSGPLPAPRAAGR